MEVEVGGGGGRKGKGCGCMGCFGSIFGLGLAAVIVVVVFWVIETSHADADAAAIAEIEKCSAVTEALGTPIEEVPYSLGCGEYSSGGGFAAASYTIPVQGPKGSGSLTYMAEQHGGPWNVHGATLSTSSGTITAVPCGGGLVP